MEWLKPRSQLCTEIGLNSDQGTMLCALFGCGWGGCLLESRQSVVIPLFLSDFSHSLAN